jgi:Carboxypeptidase regulatory-like domain
MTAKNPVTIRVVDQHGQPADGALVAVVQSSVPFPEIGMVADAKGEINLSLPEGQFTFSAHAQGGASGHVRFAVASGQSPLRVDLVLSP